jgi:hypothetical protein
MANPVVHFEVVGGDGKKLQQFYAGVFGWKIDANNPMNYGIVDNGGHGINGGVGPAPDGQPHAMFYISVPDTDEALRKIESMGGKTVMPTEVIPDMVTLAMFADPEGNVVGLVKDEEPAH